MSHPVQVHDFQAFACTSCGRCCKPWEVAIEAPQREAIEASHEYQVRVRENYQPLVIERPGVASLGDRGDDACTFLAPDNLCQLHGEIGGRLKPLGCQLYPYQAVQTPAGMYVYLSYACPPVVAGLDRDVAVNRRDLNEALGRYAAPLPDSEEQPYLVELHEERPISWASYLQLERRILDAYQRERPWDSLLEISLHLLSQPSENSEWGEIPMGTVDLEFPSELLTSYLAALIGTLERFEDDGSADVFSQAVEAGQAVRLNRLRLALPPLSLEPPGEPWFLEILERYVRDAVLGKSMMKSTVVSRLLSLACAMALVAHFAEALRRQRGLSALGLEEVTDAFRLVESDLTTHSTVTAAYYHGLADTFARLVALPEEP